MSATLAVRPADALPQGPDAVPGRRLRPLTRPTARRKPKLVYALVALGGAMAIGAAQIALSLAITQDSFALAQLSSQQHDLSLRTQALQEELTGLSSPQALASSAASLGMVVAGSPSYLRLSDGATFGTGAAAGWTSSVNPNGAGAVSNALLTNAGIGTKADETEGAETPAQDLPPAITDGLPSPTTR